MPEMNIQDELEPYLIPRGFERKRRQFVRDLDDMRMEVWLNPENRLKRVRTIDVTCYLIGSDGLEFLYDFNQARAVAEVVHGKAWGDWSYEPGQEGWPRVIVEDFVGCTLRFIDECSTWEPMMDRLLAGELPTANMKWKPIGLFQDVITIAQGVGRQDYVDRAIRHAESTVYSWVDGETLSEWSQRQGIQISVRSDPPTVRQPVDKFLPLRWRRYS